MAVRSYRISFFLYDGRSSVTVVRSTTDGADRFDWRSGHFELPIGRETTDELQPPAAVLALARALVEVLEPS